MTFTPVRYVVTRYIVEGVTLFAGRPKSGKSWLMLDFAIAVSTGAEVLGQSCEQGDVLYLDLEDTRRRVKDRLDKLVPDADWPEGLRIETTMARLKEGGIDVIRRFLQSATNPRLVIIDTLARVRSAKKHKQSLYEADYDSVVELKALAEEYHVAIVLVHHQRKLAADDLMDTISGSTGLTGAVDTVMILHKTAQSTTLFTRGRDIEEVHTAMEFDGETCKWQALGDADEVKRTSEREEILNLLRQSEEPLSPTSIAELSGRPRNNVKQLLFKMNKSGDVHKQERGLYTARQER
jgi:RecA-family ATPase